MSTVKSLSVGNGDMFYIRHGTDCFSIIDCCLSEEDEEAIIDELVQQSQGKNIVRYLSTHPDDDHVRGLTRLHQRFNFINFYCVENSAIKDEPTDDFDTYCALRDSDKAFHLQAGCTRKWLNESDETRGGSGITLLWPIVANADYQSALAASAEGGNPNNISPIIKYTLNGGAIVLWMGDLETEFMENISDVISLPAVDILFAPHHGRDSGRIPADMLEELQPQVIVIGEAPSEHLNYYEGYNTITQNSAGHIAFECEEGVVHIYVSDPSYSVDFLENLSKPNHYIHGSYIGSLYTRA